MKKLAGLVVVIAAVILGSYYGMGIITEHTLKKNIALMNQSNGITVNIEQYHRGWYRSNALINWSLHVPARTITNQAGQVTTVAAQEFQMQMPVDIYHGPIMFVGMKPMFGLGYAHSNMTLPQPYATQFTQTYTAESTPPMLDLSMFVSYLNKSVVHMNLPTFKLIAKDGKTTFEWIGMESDLTVASHRKNIQGRVMVDGFKLVKEKTTAILGTVNSDYNLHQTTLGLYLGDANLKLSKLSIKQDDTKEVIVDQWNVHSSSDVQNGLFNSHFNTSVDKLNIDGKVYGPALLDVSISNLDAVVLAKINEQSNEMQQGTDAERQQLMLSLLPELPKLVSKGAIFKISELNIVMPEGEIKGALLVSLPNAAVDNPFQLIQKIQGQGNLVFANAVLKQVMIDASKRALQQQAAMQTPVVAPAATVVPATTTAPAVVVVEPAVDINQQAMTQASERLAAMVQSGLLVIQGSDYTIDFKLADGQLSVNGKPFNPAMMQF